MSATAAIGTLSKTGVMHNWLPKIIWKLNPSNIECVGNNKLLLAGSIMALAGYHIYKRNLDRRLDR